MEQKEKPLGDWTLNECKEYCRQFRKEHPGGFCEEHGCILNKRNICQDYIHEWYLDKLTPEEVEICRLLKAKWVIRECTIDRDYVYLFRSKPDFFTDKEDKKVTLLINDKHNSIGGLSAHLFPSVKKGDCICVNEAED